MESQPGQAQAACGHGTKESQHGTMKMKERRAIRGCQGSGEWKEVRGEGWDSGHLGMLGRCDEPQPLPNRWALGWVLPCWALGGASLPSKKHHDSPLTSGRWQLFLGPFRRLHKTKLPRFHVSAFVGLAIRYLSVEVSVHKQQPCPRPSSRFFYCIDPMEGKQSSPMANSMP